MIGVFDSGSGGLTVLRALLVRAPSADIVYFADLANMPYGNKSQDELKELTRNAISLLAQYGATQIISACNSVSAQVFLYDDVEIIEMVTPTVNALAQEKDKKILLVATQATVSSNIYKDAFLEKGIHLEQIAIPPLAQAIEEKADAEKIKTILHGHLNDVASPDIVILGCTQYPLVKDAFETFFSSRNMSPEIIDPAIPVSNEALKKFNVTGSGTRIFLMSRESKPFLGLLERIFPNQDKHSIVVGNYGKNQQKAV